MQKPMRMLSVTAALVAASLLTACVAPVAYYPGRYPYPYPYASAPVAYPVYPSAPGDATAYGAPAGYAEHGRLDNIELIQGQTPGYGTSGGGAVAGGVIGGALANQVGRGNGRAAATALGVIGGALLGNAVEAQNNAPRYYQSYRLSVQTDGGAYRIFDVPSPGDLRIGDRVRIEGGQILRE